MARRNTALRVIYLDAWDFVRRTHSEGEVAGKPVAIPHKWTFYFLMAVGFWNFVGAGMFGMLAIALMVFVLRQTSDEARWASMPPPAPVERRTGNPAGPFG